MNRSKSHGKETLYERLGKPKAYSVGMQIPHCVYPEIPEESVVWCLRQRMGGLLRELARQRESRIEQGHLMLDHVHMLISIPPKYSVAQVVGYMKGKSAIYIARTFMGKPRNFTGESFWARGYFVSTVGRDEKVIREYIKNQEQEDQRIDQLSCSTSSHFEWLQNPNRFERFTTPSLRLCRRSYDSEWFSVASSRGAD